MVVVKILIIFTLCWQIHNIECFFGLNSDLQYSFKVADISSEICAKLPAVGSIAVRSYIRTTDQRVLNCSRGLTNLSTRLRTNPVNFFNEIQNVMAAQVNFESSHVLRINASYMRLASDLNFVLTTSGILPDIATVAVENDVRMLQINLQNILGSSEVLRDSFVEMASDVRRIRENVTTLTIMSPSHIHANIHETVQDDTIQSLSSIRNSVEFLINTIKSITKIAVSQGSIFDLLNRFQAENSRLKDITVRNFNTSYNSALSGILSTARSNNATAYTALNTFVRTVRSRYTDNMVGPAFEEKYYPEILSFVNLTIVQLYDLEDIEASLNSFRNLVIELTANATDTIAVEINEDTEKILDLQKTAYYASLYSTCIDDLVSAVQANIKQGTGKILSCVSERTSGVNVILPTIRLSLNVFRDNFNLVMGQLNECIRYSNANFNGLLQTLDCFDMVTVNLPYYGNFMITTAQRAFETIVNGQIRIFESCAKNANIGIQIGIDGFEQIYAKCADIGGNEDSPVTEAEETTYALT